MSSYSSENVLLKGKMKCEKQEVISIKTSNESHIYWRKYFHKIPLYFRIYSESTCDNQINYSNIRNKTPNIYHQITICNGYYIISELNDVLQSGLISLPFRI